MKYTLAGCFVLFLIVVTSACSEDTRYNSNTTIAQPSPGEPSGEEPSVGEPTPETAEPVAVPDVLPDTEPDATPEPIECEPTCNGSALCQDNAVWLCEYSCEEGCFCKPAQEGLWCRGGCREGATSDTPEALCAPGCECTRDDQCGLGSLCVDCQCFEFCGCATDEDCPEGAQCLDCECIEETPDPICTPLCEQRANNQDQNGFCPLEFMENISCAQACVQRQEALSASAFFSVENCIAQDPLCFQSLDDCIFRQLYPEPVPVQLNVLIREMERFEGNTVRFALQTDGDIAQPPPVEIEDGTVEFQEILTLYPQRMTLWFFVDVDGNGLCDPEIDYPSSADLERAPTFEMPTLNTEATLAATPSAFVCNIFAEP